MKIRPRIFLEGNFFVDLQPGTPARADARRRRHHPGHARRRRRSSSTRSSPRCRPTRARTCRSRSPGSATALTRKPTAADDAAAGPRRPRQDRPPSRSTRPSAYAADVAAEHRHRQRRAPRHRDARPHAAARRPRPHVTEGLGRNERSLQDLVTNFNTTLAAFAVGGDEPPRDARASCRRRCRPPTRRFDSAERRVPEHARVRPRDPARRPRDAGDDRRLLPVDRPGARRCSRRPSCAGLVARRSARRRATSQGRRRDASSLLPQADLISKCIDRGRPADRATSRSRTATAPRAPRTTRSSGTRWSGSPARARTSTATGSTCASRPAAAPDALDRPRRRDGDALRQRRPSRRWARARPTPASARPTSPDRPATRPDAAGPQRRRVRAERPGGPDVPGHDVAGHAGDGGRQRLARPARVAPRRAGRQGGGRVKHAISKYCDDFAAVIALAVLGLSSAATSCQPALLPAGLGAGARARTSSTTRPSSRPRSRSRPARARRSRSPASTSARSRPSTSSTAARGHDEAPQEVHADPRGRDGAPAAEDGPEGHDRPARPGHGRGGQGARGLDAIPITSTLPNVNARRDLSRARRRHARLPPAARRRRRAGARGQRQATSRRRSSASSRSAATSRRINGALAKRRANIAPLDPQLPPPRRRARATRTTSSPSSSTRPTRVFRSFAEQDAQPPARRCSSCRRRCRPRDTALAKADKLAQVLGPTLGDLRPGARALGPSLRQTRPFLRKTTPIIRDQLRPFAADVQPTVKLLQPGRPRPGQGHARPRPSFKRRQLPAQRAGLQPAGQARRASSSGLSWANHAGTSLFGTRTRTGRSAAASSFVDCIALGTLAVLRTGQPAARHARPTCSTARRQTQPDLQTLGDDPARRRRPAVQGAELDAEAGSRPSAASSSWSGFALSCFGLLLFLWLAFGGPMPLKPKGYRFNVVVRRGRRSSLRRPTSGSPASPSARSRRSSTTSGPAAPTPTIELEPKYAPMPSDTKAILRQKTLLGETYVELTPGQQDGERRHARGRPAARRPASRDRRARRDLPRLRRQDAAGLPGLDAEPGRRHRPAAAATSTTPSATSRRSREDATRPRQVLNCQERAVRASSCATPATSSTALSERQGQLRGLISEHATASSPRRLRGRRAAGDLPGPARRSSASRRRRSTA